MSRNKLYILLTISCVAGYIWLIISGSSTGFSNNETEICIIKHVTNIPCPSCGSTRSVFSLMNGKIIEALYWNPIGILLAIIMMFAPVWIIIDYFNKKESLFIFYNKAELFFRKKLIIIPSVILIAANWIWNIYKGL